MRRIFRLVVILLVIPSYNWARGIDTVLVYMQTTPYALNIIQGDNGIYLGTSQGVQSVSGLRIEMYNHIPGYVIMNNGVEVTKEVSFSSPIFFNYSSFLPDKYRSARIQMVREQSLLYVVASGAFFIYEIRPYTIDYRGFSIRHMTENYLATYSGFYKNGQSLEHLSYSSGKIYEYDDTLVVCYDGLYVELPDTQFFRVDGLSGLYESKGQHYGHAREFTQSWNDHKVLFTTAGVYHLDSLYQVEELILMNDKGVYHRENLEPFMQPHLLHQVQSILIFSFRNKVYRYDIHKRRYLDSLILPAPVSAGLGLPGEFEMYIATTDGLFFTPNWRSIHKISEDKDIHTMGQYEKQYVFCSSNSGLRMYDRSLGQMQTLLDGVEFNQFAMHVGQDTLLVGSVDGLYHIPIEHLPRLITLSTQIEFANLRDVNQITVTEVLILVGVLGIIFFLFYMGSGTRNALPPTPTLSSDVQLRHRIVMYIQEHLDTVSIEQICKEFEFSNTKLYALSKPEKPGELIRRLRTEKVRELRAQGYSKAEIARATGFSVNYVGRVR